MAPSEIPVVNPPWGAQVQYHSHGASVAMPPCLQTLPLRSLYLQGARVSLWGIPMEKQRTNERQRGRIDPLIDLIYRSTD